MDCDRRDFMRALLLAGAGAVAPQAALASGRQVSSDSLGVLVDLSKCNGCRRCEAACLKANDNGTLSDTELADESVFAQHRDLGPDRFTVVNRYGGDERAGGGDQPVFVKSNCMHCLDPGCVSACIVGALERRPDGTVTYDAGKCIGCRYCMVACPFQVPAYEYDTVMTPRVRKCELCASLRASGEATAPACVTGCPKECMTFAKRADLIEHAHAKIAARPELYLDHVYGEHEAGGTGWLYLAAVPFASIGFPTLADAAPPRLSETIQHGVFARFMPPLAWLGILSLTMWLTRPGSSPVAQLAAEVEPAQAGSASRGEVA